MATFTWTTPTTIATGLSTEMNSLASAGFTAVGPAIDNETGKHPYIDLELVLASLTPTGVPYCAIFFIASIDTGTNFEDVANASSVPNVIIPFTTATAAKRKTAWDILVPPLQFKLVLQNNMGVALAASGNTIRYRFHDELST